MKFRNVSMLMAVMLIFTLRAPAASADTLKLKDDTKIEGIIQKVESGRVYVTVNESIKVFDILDIKSMEFNTPRLATDSKVPIEHFMKSTEAQELVRNLELLNKSAEEIRKRLVQIQSDWDAKQPIDSKEESAWLAAKDSFRQPLMSYQEILNDLYFHVLARVDEYNNLMKDASKVYVGIKGIRVGSSLVPSDMQRLPLRKYVPTAWYDTIFYEGYTLGFSDAAAGLTSRVK
jgi:hypothetical protein